jgi:hypothetical protein
MSTKRMIMTLAFFGLILSAHYAQAQERKTRILFILDASSSMTLEWNKDYTKFGVARNILLQVIDSVYALNNEVEFAVRVYGVDYPSQEKNCTDSKLVVPFNLQNTNQIKRSLNFIHPIGSSPIAYSLSQAAFNEINNANLYDYSIIFITDGGESCDGDICKTYLELLKNKVSVTPYIIGLDKNDILRSYYDCLGKYVDVLRTDDIPRAVKLIVDANRSIINKPKKLNLKTTYSNTEIKKDTTEPKKEIVVKKIDTPAVKPIIVKQKKVDSVVKKIVTVPKVKRTPDIFPRVQPIQTLRTLATSSRQPIVQLKRNSMPVGFNITLEPPKPIVQRRSDVFPRVETQRVLKIQLTKRTQPIAQLKRNNIPVTFSMTIEEPKPIVQREKPQVFSKLSPFPRRYRFTYAFQSPRANVVSNKIPVTFNINYTPVKRDTIVQDLTTKKIETSTTNKKVNISRKNEVDISRELIPNDKTMVQIFFINQYEKKKVYRNTTPRIIVSDPNSNRELNKFTRTVTNGEPDLQPIEAGVYNFTVVGKNNIKSKEVRIEKNQINRIYFSVTDGTLQFSYMGNPKRPVKEYQADVRIRFDKRGKNVEQRCDEVLPYMPGTYYVSVNTTPATRFITVDLYFNAVTELMIAEPGQLQITNLTNRGLVDLKEPKNDSYFKFLTMRINGDFASQKIEIQPGTYKAEFLIDPAKPALGTKEISFRVRSNQTTLLNIE